MKNIKKLFALAMACMVIAVPMTVNATDKADKIKAVKSGEIKLTQFTREESGIGKYVDKNEIENKDSKSIYMSTKLASTQTDRGNVEYTRFAFMNQTGKDAIVTVVTKTPTKSVIFGTDSDLDKDSMKPIYTYSPNGEDKESTYVFKLKSTQNGDGKIWVSNFLYDGTPLSTEKPESYEIYVQYNTSELPTIHSREDIVNYLDKNTVKYTLTRDVNTNDYHARLIDSSKKADKKVDTVKKAPEKSSIFKNKLFISGVVIVAITGLALIVIKLKKKSK